MESPSWFTERLTILKFGMKKLIYSFLFAIITCSLILAPSIAHADEKVTTLKQGDVAPFAGTLFNTEAAARILTEIESSQAFCNLEIETKLKEQAAEYELKISTLNSELKFCQDTSALRLKIKENQNIFLQDQLKKNTNFFTPSLTFVAGIVLGSAFTIGITYTVVQTTK